jgi:hypothetical protein
LSALHFLPLHGHGKFFEMLHALSVILVVCIVSLAQNENDQLIAVNLPKASVSKRHAAQLRNTSYHSIAVSVQLAHELLQLLFVVKPGHDD